MTDIRKDKDESQLQLWKQRIAEWRRLSPEEQQRRRLEAIERRYQLVREGKIDDDWYDRYMRENNTAGPLDVNSAADSQE